MQKIEDQMDTLFTNYPMLWIFLTFIYQFIIAFIIFLFLVLFAKLLFPSILPKDISNFLIKSQHLNILSFISIVYESNKHLILPLALYTTYKRFQMMIKFVES